jgi:hypothetical protein
MRKNDMSRKNGELIFIALICVACIGFTAVCGCVEVKEKVQGESGLEMEESGAAVHAQNTPAGHTTTQQDLPPIPEGMSEEYYYQVYLPQYYSTHPTESVIATDAASTVSAAPPIHPENVDDTPPLHAQERPSLPSSPDVIPIFTGSYSLLYTDIGLMVDVARAPLVIEFTTWPRHEDPYHCFLYVTVRDYETLDVVAEDGYGRIYSSDRTKRIVIREQGAYHINLYGNLLDVDLTVSTGG